MKFSAHCTIVLSSSVLIPKRSPPAASLSPTPPRKSSSQGEIIAVGPGGRDESGKLIPIDLKVGDRVRCSENGPEPKSNSTASIT